MGVTVTCANQTASLAALNVPGPTLFSKLSDSECLTLLFQEDARPHDRKEKVMKTRGRRENIEVTGFEYCSIEIGKKKPQTRLVLLDW